MAALVTAPAVAKIRELRLGIQAPTNDARRPLNMSAGYAPALRERWAGQVLWADLSRSDSAALQAFFESLDGRVTPFGLPLAAGFASQYVAGNASLAGTLASIPAPGADRIRVSASGSPTLRPGTLISLGVTDPDTGPYQVVEVLESAPADGATDIYIAPRIRHTMTTTAVTLGTVTGSFVLAADVLPAQMVPAYGSLALDIVEAL